MCHSVPLIISIPMTYGFLGFLYIQSGFLHQKHKTKKGPKFGLFPSNLALNEDIWKVTYDSVRWLFEFQWYIVFLGFYIAKVSFYIKNTNFAPKESHNSGSTPLTWRRRKIFSEQMCDSVPLIIWISMIYSFLWFLHS